MLNAQSCLTFSDPMDCCPPGSSVHRIFQARILEWLPFSPPGYLPDPVIEPVLPELQADSLPTEPPGKSCLKLMKVFNSKGLLNVNT